MKRIWEVDAARGAAILMMLLSNLLFDLSLFAGCEWCYQGFWIYFARAVAALFLLLVGISLTLSYSRSPRFKKFLKRGLKILGYGFIITLITYPIVQERAVFFGILHLIGVSIILSFPLIKRKIVPFVLGAIAIAIGILSKASSNIFYFILNTGSTSIDYTPLLPWIGFIFIGISLGNFLFPGGKPILKERSFHLAAIGRKSLIIYFIHQPIFLGILFLIGVITL